MDNGTVVKLRAAPRGPVVMRAEPPRDRTAALAGLCVVAALGGVLGWAVLGPGGTRIVRAWPMVWVNIVPGKVGR